MITYDFTPTTGYLNRGHSISIDLPIKLNQVNGGTDRGFERKILVNVPPSEQPGLDTTDGVMPAIARRTYEPYQPIIHHLNNNEMSINEFSIIVSDMFSMAPPTDNIGNASIYFVIRL